jgi:ParB family chromosome partitioning protein
LLVTTTAATETLHHLPTEALFPNPDQPRKRFERSALDELAASIRQFGVAEPLLVRRPSQPALDGAEYMIVAGERRWRAAQEAGVKYVPCRILDVDDARAYVLTVTENVVRRDFDPIEEGKAYKALLDTGKSFQEVGDLFGKPGGVVKFAIELLDLREDIQPLVASRQMPLYTAWHMSRLTLPNQAVMLAKLNAGELPTDDAAVRFAKALKMKEDSPSLFDAPVEHDELAAERRRVRRGKIEVAWAKVETIASHLGPLLELSPADMETTLSGDTNLYLQRLEALRKSVTRVCTLLRNAHAIHEAKQN